MPELAPLHPIIVHFVIALLMVGVALRLLALIFKKGTWLSPAAVLLLVLGTSAAVLAVRSGDEAHGPAERVPGARNAVVEHEEWGERTRNIFLIVAAVELVALAVGAGRLRRGLHLASGVVGLIGAYALYETGEHGGELVYEYAGGVGVRTGDAADLNRLLTAGLYHNIQEDRRNGRHVDAARLVDEMASRNPDDAAVGYLLVESMLLDRNDPERAMALLDGMTFPNEDWRLSVRHANLMADALKAMEQPDSAQAYLRAVREKLPEPAQARIDSRLNSP